MAFNTTTDLFVVIVIVMCSLKILSVSCITKAEVNTDTTTYSSGYSSFTALAILVLSLIHI